MMGSGRPGKDLCRGGTRSALFYKAHRHHERNRLEMSKVGSKRLVRRPPQPWGRGDRGEVGGRFPIWEGRGHRPGGQSTCSCEKSSSLGC